MPLETPLSSSPHFESYDPNKDYYRVLFQPGVAVQVRELNDLQAIFQAQIERFGDAIFKTGTIVDGCNFNFLPQYPFIKLADTQVDGETAVPSRYQGLFVKNISSGLRAFVLDYEDGFEATPPDLKTLYIHYNNAGLDANTFAFDQGDQLEVTDANVSIFDVSVTNGAVGFSNGQHLVFTSAAVVNTQSGTFTNGQYVSQVSTGANLQIINIDDTTLAANGQIILTLKPRDVDLANSSIDPGTLRAANNESIKNAANTATGLVELILGDGAAGEVVTDGVGKITTTVMTSQGGGY